MKKAMYQVSIERFVNSQTLGLRDVHAVRKQDFCVTFAQANGADGFKRNTIGSQIRQASGELLNQLTLDGYLRDWQDLWFEHKEQRADLYLTVSMSRGELYKYLADFKFKTPWCLK